MANTLESGHLKTVANFDALISFASSDASYNPAKAALKIDVMKELSAKCKSAIEAVNSALASYSKAIDARERDFMPLSKIVTRVSNALKASASDEQTDQSAMSIIKKITGRRPKAKKSEQVTGSDTETSTISTSQMGYDNRLGNFDKLIQFLATIPEYMPNEKELQVESLKALHRELATKNAAVIEASTVLKNARLARNELLYKSTSGLVDIALDAKSYLKSLFGPSSARFKQVSGLEFRKN